MSRTWIIRGNFPAEGQSGKGRKEERDREDGQRGWRTERGEAQISRSCFCEESSLSPGQEMSAESLHSYGF